LNHEVNGKIQSGGCARKKYGKQQFHQANDLNY
ncbi:hypothetical protein CCACVL1_25228, partial [Corchorus capsularis]